MQTEGDDGIRPEDEFRFVLDVDLSEEKPAGFHVHNLAIAEILFNGRNQYLATVGVDWPRMIASGKNLVIRQLTIDYESEGPEGVALRCGVRTATRSNRSVTLDEWVWVADAGTVIARARSVHVSVQLDPPAAIEVPADLWARIERFESAGA